MNNKLERRYLSLLVLAMAVLWPSVCFWISLNFLRQRAWRLILMHLAVALLGVMALTPFKFNWGVIALIWLIPLLLCVNYIGGFLDGVECDHSVRGLVLFTLAGGFVLGGIFSQIIFGLGLLT